jgi:hypothetical protein
MSALATISSANPAHGLVRLPPISTEGYRDCAGLLESESGRRPPAAHGWTVTFFRGSGRWICARMTFG